MAENVRNERVEKSERKTRSIEKSQRSSRSQKKEGSEKSQENKFIIEESMKSPNIPKEQLEKFDTGTDFIFLIQNLKRIIQSKELDWTYHLAVVNYLRRLLKYEPNIFNQIFYGLKIYPKIIELINSVRSVLAKNTLMLINEMFGDYIPEYDDKNNKNQILIFIKAVIPTLILKANCNQSFIKIEANSCLESLVKNMRYGDTLNGLIQVMKSKKNQEIELAFNLTIKLCDNLTVEYLGENNLFNEIIKSIVGIYELKKDIYVKKIIKVIEKIRDKLNISEFNSKLEKCSKKERELIKKALDTKINNKPKKKDTTSSEFQAFINKSKEGLKAANGKNTNKGNNLLVKMKTESTAKKNKI